MTNVQEHLAGTTIAFPPMALRQHGKPAGPAMYPAMPSRGDSIRLAGPNATDALNMPFENGGMGSVISELLSIVQQLMSMLGLGGLGGFFGGPPPPQTQQTFFQNASGSSSGDPHLSFDGTDGSGGAHSSRFDSMTSHADLLDSDSFAGGYQISTNVTQPGANGITYNQQATVSTAFGSTQVSLDSAGNALVTQNGQSTQLSDGQSIDLGNGETVSRDQNGSVVINDDNAVGGSVTTTLSENGQGVDVNVQANDVGLGGDLVQHVHVMEPMRPPFVRRQG